MLSRYGLALLIAVLTLMLTLQLAAVPGAPFILFLGGVVGSALYGGLGPALLNLLLSAEFINFFFIPPYHRFSFLGAGAEDLLSLALFIMVSVSAGCLAAGSRRAQENWQASEKYYRLLATHSTDAIVGIGGKQEILFVNTAAQKLLGRPLDHLVGQKLLLASDLDQLQIPSPTRFRQTVPQQETSKDSSAENEEDAHAR